MTTQETPSIAEQFERLSIPRKVLFGILITPLATPDAIDMAVHPVSKGDRVILPKKISNAVFRIVGIKIPPTIVRSN